jgi:ABC-type sugar transport system permease subunit
LGGCISYTAYAAFLSCHHYTSPPPSGKVGTNKYAQKIKMDDNIQAIMNQGITLEGMPTHSFGAVKPLYRKVLMMMMIIIIIIVVVVVVVVLCCQVIVNRNHN